MPIETSNDLNSQVWGQAEGSSAGWHGCLEHDSVSRPGTRHGLAWMLHLVCQRTPCDFTARMMTTKYNDKKYSNDDIKLLLGIAPAVLAHFDESSRDPCMCQFFVNQNLLGYLAPLEAARRTLSLEGRGGCWWATTTSRGSWFPRRVLALGK